MTSSIQIMKAMLEWSHFNSKINDFSNWHLAERTKSNTEIFEIEYESTIFNTYLYF